MVFQRAPAGGALTTLMVLKGTTGNFGIGATTPTQKFEVNGGVRLNTVTSKPTCDSTARGTFWVEQGSPSDTVYVCLMINSVYSWKTVTLQ